MNTNVTSSSAANQRSGNKRLRSPSVDTDSGETLHKRQRHTESEIIETDSPQSPTSVADPAPAPALVESAQDSSENDAGDSQTDEEDTTSHPDEANDEDEYIRGVDYDENDWPTEAGLAKIARKKRFIHDLSKYAPKPMDMLHIFNEVDYLSSPARSSRCHQSSSINLTTAD